MSLENRSLSERIRAVLERVLALRAPQPVRYAHDPYNIFQEDKYSRRSWQVALALTLLLHIILFVIVFPSFGSRVFVASEQVVVLRNLAKPAALVGGGDLPKAAPKKPTVPKPKPIFVPIPDPTPNAPEPIIKREIEDIPEILEEIADLNIGDITAPPGPAARGRAGAGTGTGSARSSLEGSGPGTGSDGIYEYGSGITNPEPIFKSTPSYTDDAIRAKVQGTVVLQAVIRKDGRVDRFKVVRGLGYGLEETAIQEIATRWKFRPGTLNGRPVDVLATIEVSFNLR